jgi:hypothetical protein
MSHDSDIFAALQAHAPLTALIGAGTACRAYPDAAPQDSLYPLVVITRIAGVPDVALEGPTNLWNCRYQFSIWADAFDVAVDVGDKVYAAINAATAFQKVALNLYSGPVESELKLYHRIAEFSTWSET